MNLYNPINFSARHADVSCVWQDTAAEEELDKDLQGTETRKG